MQIVCLVMLRACLPQRFLQLTYAGQAFPNDIFEEFFAAIAFEMADHPFCDAAFGCDLRDDLCRRQFAVVQQISGGAFKGMCDNFLCRSRINVSAGDCLAVARDVMRDYAKERA